MTNEIQGQAVAVEQAGARVYTPDAVAWASVFGSPVAGSVVMAMNYSRWGKKGAAWKAVGLGVVGTVALGMLSVYLSAGAGMGLPDSDRGRDSDAAIGGGVPGEEGGGAPGGGGQEGVELEGRWGWGAADVVVDGSARGVVCERGWEVAELVRYAAAGFGGGPVRRFITLMERRRRWAQALGTKLHEIGFLKDGAATIYLSGTGKEKELSFVVQDEAWSRPEAVQTLKQVTELVADAIGGKPVTVRMLDRQTHEKNRIVVN